MRTATTATTAVATAAVATAVIAVATAAYYYYYRTHQKLRPETSADKRAAEEPEPRVTVTWDPWRALQLARRLKSSRDPADEHRDAPDYDSDADADREILEMRPPPMFSQMRSLARRVSSVVYRGGTLGDSIILDEDELTGGRQPSSRLSLVSLQLRDSLVGLAASQKRLSLAFLTYNINGATLSAEDAVTWAMQAGPADAYFVCLQELIDIVDAKITTEEREAMSVAPRPACARRLPHASDHEFRRATFAAGRRHKQRSRSTHSRRRSSAYAAASSH